MDTELVVALVMVLPGWSGAQRSCEKSSRSVGRDRVGIQYPDGSHRGGPTEGDITTTAPVQPTSSDRSIRTAGPAAPARRRARRTAVRLAGLALAAGTVLGGLGPAAHAESPPAPKPTLPVVAPKPGPAVVGPVADAPAGPNTGRIFATAFESGDTWSDATFRSNRATVIVQISTTKPHWEGDVLTMGAVSPVVLHGTPVPSLEHDRDRPHLQLQGEPRGSHPRHHLPRARVDPRFERAELATAAQFATKSLVVRMTPMATHVSNDSDKGANNGEVHFGSSLAPTATPWASAGGAGGRRPTASTAVTTSTWRRPTSATP